MMSWKIDDLPTRRCTEFFTPLRHLKTNELRRYRYVLLKVGIRGHNF
jgi:hypothetical protein